MTITEFLNARYDEEEAIAQGADVKQEDPSWTPHGPIALSDPRSFRVRSDRDSRPVALVQDVGDDEEGPTSILDGEAVAAHIARHDPARVLADIAAKRAIVAAAVETLAVEEVGFPADEHGLNEARSLAEFTIRTFAQPFAEHADFDPAWRT